MSKNKADKAVKELTRAELRAVIKAGIEAVRMQTGQESGYAAMRSLLETDYPNNLTDAIECGLVAEKELTQRTTAKERRVKANLEAITA